MVQHGGHGDVPRALAHLFRVGVHRDADQGLVGQVRQRGQVNRRVGTGAFIQGSLRSHETANAAVPWALRLYEPEWTPVKGAAFGEAGWVQERIRAGEGSEDLAVVILGDVVRPQPVQAWQGRPVVQHIHLRLGTIGRYNFGALERDSGHEYAWVFEATEPLGSSHHARREGAPVRGTLDTVEECCLGRRRDGAHEGGI